MKLEIGSAYVNKSGGWPSDKEILYFGGSGKWPGKCDHCGKEFDGTHMAYSFTIGSPDERVREAVDASGGAERGGAYN